MKKIKTNYALICCALFTALTITSCEKEQSIKHAGEGEIKFIAGYGIPGVTKAPETFPAGNKATIFAFQSEASTATASMVSGTPLEATAEAGGVLTPSSSLFLPKGSYDFYSVSLNNSITPGLSFTGGVSGILSNSTDYLWAKAGPVVQGGTVNFSYTHSATGIEINVTPGSGVSSLQVTAIKFTPAKADALSVMNIGTGEIGASSQKDNLVSANLNGNSGTYIMLPLSSASLDVEITINATIGQTSVTAKKYTATIPARSYTGGTYYTINLNVTATSLSFTGSQIEEWNTQDISGITLIEQ